MLVKMSSCRQCLFGCASFCIVIPKILSVLCQSCVQLQILNLIKSAVVHNSDTWQIVLKYFRSVPTGDRTLICRMRGERSTTKKPRRSYWVYSPFVLASKSRKFVRNESNCIKYYKWKKYSTEETSGEKFSSKPCFSKQMSSPQWTNKNRKLP